jgi:hypothetical protein
MLTQEDAKKAIEKLKLDFPDDGGRCVRAILLGSVTTQVCICSCTHIHIYVHTKKSQDSMKHKHMYIHTYIHTYILMMP